VIKLLATLLHGIWSVAVVVPPNAIVGVPIIEATRPNATRLLSNADRVELGALLCTPHALLFRAQRHEDRVRAIGEQAVGSRLEAVLGGLA